MAAHARHLRAHVDRLADKAYWSALPDTPEFVVLFVPGEAFLAPALEHDPALLEHAYARRVHLATPTTLVSLLRTVAHAWQQEQLTENARAVVAAGKELYARLGTLGGHVDKLGRSLGTAVADYNRTVGSLERTLLPAARRMAELGLADEPPAAPGDGRGAAASAGRARAARRRLCRARAEATSRPTSVDVVRLAELDGRHGHDVGRRGAGLPGGRPAAGGRSPARPARRSPAGAPTPGRPARAPSPPAGPGRRSRAAERDPVGVVGALRRAEDPLALAVRAGP